MNGVSNPFLALPTNRAAKPGVHRSGWSQPGQPLRRRPRHQPRHRRRARRGAQNSPCHPDPPGHRPARPRARRTRPDTVLAIDEAHMLEPAQLEAVRMLTNHDLDSGSPLACLLIGQPTLRRRIKLGILAALDQRIAVRYTMPGMTPQETASYITHHLNTGRSEPLFSDDATTLITPPAAGCPGPSTTSRSRPSSPPTPAAKPSSTNPAPAPPPPRSRQTDHRASTHTKAPPEHHRRGFPHQHPHRQCRRHHQAKRPRTTSGYALPDVIRGFLCSRALGVLELTRATDSSMRGHGRPGQERSC